MVRKQKGISLFFKDINTQIDQFCQFSMAQFTVVVHNPGTTKLFVSCPESQKVGNHCSRVNVFRGHLSWTSAKTHFGDFPRWVVLTIFNNALISPVLVFNTLTTIYI